MKLCVTDSARARGPAHTSLLALLLLAPFLAALLLLLLLPLRCLFAGAM